jgi:hypothetical protein
MRGDDAYYRGKRGPLWRKKSPTIEEKETYYGGKRDIRQPVRVDDAYCRGKRDILWRKKRHTTP